MFDFIMALLILSLISVVFGFVGFITGAVEITQLCGFAFMILMLLGVSTTVTAFRRHIPL